MNHRIFLTTCVIIVNLVGIGPVAAKDYPDWDGFAPLFSMTGVIEFEGKVYGTSKGGVFRYDPETREYTLFYKNHGLASNDVRCVAATSEYLFFGFGSAGLMRFDPRKDRFEPILFPEYVPNRIGIRSIYALNDSILYVGHSVGLDVLNIRTQEVRTCTRLGGILENTPVNDVKVFKGKIWVCTPSGLAIADENNPNLEIRSSWDSYVYTYLGAIVGLYTVAHVKDEFEERIYFGTHNRGIVYFDETDQRFYETAITFGRALGMASGLGYFWAASSDGLYRKHVRHWSTASGEFKNITAVWGDEEKVWVATQNDGIKCFDGTKYVDVAPVPGSRDVRFTRIELDEDGSIWTLDWLKDSLSTLRRYKDGSWITYGKLGMPREAGASSATLDRFGNLWVTIWGDYTSGAYVIENGVSVNPDSAMKPLDAGKEIIKATITNSYVVCSDMMRDNRGNIWVANYQLNQPDDEGKQSHNIEPVPTSGAVVFDGYPINKYRHFSPANGDIETAKISRLWADDDGWIWMGTYKYGLMGVRYGADPFDASKPVTKVSLKTSDGMNSPRVNALHHDADGYVRVGTDAGLNRIAKLSNDRVRVDSMNQLLLTAGAEIFAIEVDRMNNKWIGTSNGLVRINAINETINVYTVDNSGLFSNTIYELKYDDRRNILWVGTDAGLNTYHVLGANISDSDRIIRAYPNPFSIWGSDSRCTFDNLMQDGALRIYTFSGELVNELKVNGISARGTPFVIWDGRNFKNEFVASGVYFFTGRDKGGRPFRDKMVVIRR